MKFMNSIEIDNAVWRYADHPVLGPATQTLANLRDAADENSDGWAYWPKPARAARLLMELIDQDPFDGADATPEKLRKAYAPLKAFRTRTGIVFEIVGTAEKPSEPELAVGDFVFDTSGDEWEVTAIGGPNDKAYHLKRTIRTIKNVAELQKSWSPRTDRSRG